MTAAPESPPAEFSRLFDAAGLGEGEKRLNLEASGAERSGLAERFAIITLDSLSAHIVLTAQDGGRRVKASGRLKARIVQACVISLEPLTTTIDAAFERLFVEGAAKDLNDWEGEPEGVEIHLDSSQEDPPDAMTGGFFDLGEALAEQLALEIPPFPRTEKAVKGWEVGETKGENPFAVLKKLKPGGG